MEKLTGQRTFGCSWWQCNDCVARGGNVGVFDALPMEAHLREHAEHIVTVTSQTVHLEQWEG